VSPLDLLVDAVRALPRPATVGLSGFGGAGKTTLCAGLAAQVPGLCVVPADDFLDPAGCAVVSEDWAGLDRARLHAQVLAPFRAGSPVRWQRHDWTAGLAEWHVLPPCEVLVVEGVGVLHPLLRWDLSVWLDVPAAVARDRGVERDRALYGTSDEELWREVWAPTDAAFLQRFHPDAAANLLLRG
jgi:uridine kinase